MPCALVSPRLGPFSQSPVTIISFARRGTVPVPLAVFSVPRFDLYPLARLGRTRIRRIITYHISPTGLQQSSEFPASKRNLLGRRPAPSSFKLASCNPRSSTFNVQRSAAEAAQGAKVSSCPLPPSTSHHVPVLVPIRSMSLCYRVLPCP